MAKKKNRILYRVVNWKCASHRANLAVQFVVCGRSRDSDLRANCSRLYKYIMPQYADEIGANLRTFILENLLLEHEEVSGFEDRVDYALLNLYGHGVIPFELVQFLNHDIQRLVHRCPPGTNLAAARGELFAQLYKLVCRVETHPVVTRMWTFTNCIWAMLLCKLLGLPNYIFSTSAVQLRPENERRMQRFRIWWQKPETSSHLRTVSLCLRLTKLAVDLASQKPKEDSNDGARMLPTVVRLGQAAVEKATGALCGSILGRLAADPVLDLTETVQSLLLTQIEIHLRFFDFQLWPACLWRLSIKYNPDGYIAAIEHFVNLERGYLDRGFSAILHEDAWAQQDYSAAVAFLLETHVQAEICHVLESSQSSSLDIERQIQQDKKAEKKDKVSSLHRASSSSILSQYGCWRRSRLFRLAAEKKSICKFCTMTPRALAIQRNPTWFARGRGQLHWEDRVSSKARRTITHAGDEQRLATYIEDNRQQLEQEAAALRKNAKQKKTRFKTQTFQLQMCNG